MIIKKIEYRQDIQLLRGLAVLIVVLFHIKVPYLKNGFLGVDIFFVISGFLMAKTYDKGTILDFYKRRINRLYSVYALTILATLVAGSFLTIPVDFNQLFEQVIASSFFVANFYYWNQNSYFDNAAFNPLLNLWSLALEIQFYLIVPFIYPLLRYRKWLLFLVFSISLLACFYIQSISPKTSFFIMPFRIWEFLIGAYVAWFPFKNIGYDRNSQVYNLFLLTALISSIFIIEIKPDAVSTILYGHPALPALLVCLLTGLFINYGYNFNIFKGILYQLILKIGNYSYSIYALHFPVIILLNYIPFGGTRLEINSYQSFFIVIILIGLVSLISYIFIENKFSSTFNNLKFRFSILIITLISAYSLLYLNLNQYSTFERNIFAAWTDRDYYRCGKIFRIINPFEIICKVDHIKDGKKILLIGNSHADSIKNVFMNKAIQHGASTFFVVNNDPLLGKGPLAENYIERVTKLNIDVIVIHYNNIYANDEFVNELTKLIKLAYLKNVKVFLIAPVPSYEAHIPQTLFENPRIKEGLYMTKQVHLEKTQKFRDIALGLEHLGVEVFDPSDFFCSPVGACFVSTDDFKPYYFDSHHLTLTGAALLKPLFERLLIRI